MKVFTKKFALGMFIYALVLAVAIIAGLFALTLFVADYESSRPLTVVKAFVNKAGDSAMNILAQPTNDTLNHNLMSEEDSLALMREAIRSARIVYDAKASSADKEVYYLKDGDTLIGSIVLTPQEKSYFGFTHYSVLPYGFDLSYLTAEKTITVPAEYKVYCDGLELTENDIVERDIHYALLDEFYGSIKGLPTMVTYTTGTYLREPEFVVKDTDGKLVEDLSEESYIDNCSDEQKELLSAASRAFVEAYITYSSNVNRNTSGNYFRLENLMVMGSELQKRMRYAVAGLGFSSSMGDELVGIEYHNFMALDNEIYIVDLTYTVDTIGQDGHVVTDNNLKLSFDNSSGTLLVSAMSSY